LTFQVIQKTNRFLNYAAPCTFDNGKYLICTKSNIREKFYINTSISLTVSIPALASYINPNFNSPLISSDEEVKKEDGSCNIKL